MVAAPRGNSVEFHWWKVKVTMLKDRKKGQRSKCGSAPAPAPVEPAEQFFWSFFGGIPPVIWRIGRVLVAPSGG